ncbi:MAG TPA: deoxyguanosinetriphosphate triphosphohydrolase [Dermatophilaceae bacterium]|nr:deoxyguanosinetriphosphate triphosphohydrolase [Dermatophilaceae bacterium]
MSGEGGYDGHDRARWVPEDPGHKQADRDDFARDRARVVHCSALRRLSAKTQVVQPDSSDFVRNRLTHSLEVAQIGREFGAALGCSADVVDAACLAHDLGHPPFGHNGEEALDEVAKAAGGFEGNAQTLRLLTRLEAKRAHPDGRPAGLNLTRASLDASTKYPWARDESPYVTTKFGVYPDDQAVFAWLREGAPTARRCVEAQAMDWADDVAYSVHDVEDAIALRRVDPRVFRSPAEMAGVFAKARELYAADLTDTDLGEALDRLLGTGCIPLSHDGTRADLAELKDMTSRLIGRFVGAVERATRQRYGRGPLTRYAADLVVPDATRAECALLKGVSAQYVMYLDERLVVMAEQRQVLRDLADVLLNRPDERLDPAYRGDFEQATDDGGRLRAVVDQLASWTDLRALAMHRAWCS